MSVNEQKTTLSTPQFINKPTAAVHIRNSYTATERKLLNICLYEGIKDNFSRDLYYINVREALVLLGCDKSKNSAWLKKELFEALRRKSIRWNVFRKDSRLQEWTCSFLAGYVDEPEEGKLAFQFNPMVVKYFQQRRLYSRLLLQIQAPIKSAYALTLYEFLNDELHRSKLDQKNILISLIDLRILFDLSEGQYTEFKHFNNQAIKPAFTEINEHTDIKAEFRQIRERRRVTGLCIQVKRQKRYQLALNLAKTESIEQTLSESNDQNVEEVILLKAYGISTKKANNISTNFPRQQIVANLKYSLEQYNQNKIAHFTSFLIKAIEKNYVSGFSNPDSEEEMKNEWSSYRLKRIEERFSELSKNSQAKFKKAFEESIEQEPVASITRKKFQYDGGWESQWVQHEFRKKFLTQLLELPEEIDFSAFADWRAKQEIKDLIAGARGTMEGTSLQI